MFKSIAEQSRGAFAWLKPKRLMILVAAMLVTVISALILMVRTEPPIADLQVKAAEPPKVATPPPKTGRFRVQPLSPGFSDQY